MSKELKLHVEFLCGEVVFLKCATEKLKGIVTGISIRMNHQILFLVAWGNRTDTWHFGEELTPTYTPEFIEEPKQ